MTHHIFRLTLDGNLFIAPIGETPQRVLDLGTGTGIWAIEFADLYPTASVVGTDLSPIQPLYVPPNLQFEVDDFELPWTYRTESFDFIHARALYGSVADHPALYQQVLAHLKPGGWFEHTEVGVVPFSDDGSIQGTTLEDWGELSVNAGEKFGRTLKIVDQTKGLMEAAGFRNVTYKVFKWPMGPWAKDRKLKEIGLYNRVNWDEGMEGWLMFLFTKFHGVSPICPSAMEAGYLYIANSAASGHLIKFESTSHTPEGSFARKMFIRTKSSRFVAVKSRVRHEVAFLTAEGLPVSPELAHLRVRIENFGHCARCPLTRSFKAR